MIELVLADSFEYVPTLPAESVDAIVTSPPYGDLREYGGAEPDEYAAWIRPLLEDLYRVLSPTGGFLLNLGPIHRDGVEHPYLEDVLAACRELGWLRLDTIVWVKRNAAGPSDLRKLHRKHEFVYWLGKDVDAYRGFDETTRKPHSPETIDRYTRPMVKGKSRGRAGYRYGNLHPDGARPPSVIETVVGKRKGIAHTATMALELAQYLVALSCPPGGLVLDPFCGAGTTLLAAEHLGRRSLGIDHDPAAIREAQRLTRQPPLFPSIWQEAEAATA